MKYYYRLENKIVETEGISAYNGKGKVLCSSFYLEDVVNAFVFDKCLIHLNRDNTWRYITNPITIRLEMTNDMEIYAGIWTKNGLKYVAKRQGKGEWELLKK